MRVGVRGAVVAVVTVGVLVGVTITVAATRASSGGDAAAPFASVDPGAGASNGRPTAVFLGDSITVGNSDLTSARGLGGLSWFTSMVRGSGAPVRYAGAVARNGMTTDWMLEHVGDALADEPDWLIVLGGTNDVAAGIPLEDTIADLRAIVESAAARGVRVAVTTVPPRDGDDVNATTMALNDAIRNLDGERGLVVLDVVPAVSDAQGRWLEGLTDDGVHPNAEGARLMGEAAAASFVSLP